MKQNLSVVPMIQEAERVIAEAVKHFKLTVKPEQICVTLQSKGRKQAVGWFWPQKWSADKKSVHEINMSAECLQSYDMGELMLHELAHAENNVLGIKDCSGRQHNTKFKTMAERLGLEVKPRDKSVGLGFTALAQGGKDFLAGIKFNAKIFSAYRGGANAATKGKVGSRLVKCECAACGYVVRTTRKWLDDVGAPLCPCNKQEMMGE
jgi:hypothetical protein